VKVRKRRSGRQAIRLYPGGKEYETYLMYHVDKCLGIVPTEAVDNFDPISLIEAIFASKDEVVQEEGMINKGTTDQIFADRFVEADKVG